ncbi:MFS transporter [Streptomyces sp. NBC_00091]|uniref:MFS transporter n=1 Tax=Streptomyces sp. NBC_00091 TaxID=2975648 RepID=UPI00225A35FD|nr:MFS transporter [Streptomyces sp. NBC_00091]MCX5380538.1 MFS transporter [Streptomyces sp. NBC_00091]
MSRAKGGGTAALYAVFFLNGIVLASWAPRIPQVKERLGLSDGQLGLALLGVALGSVPAMPAAGALVNRFGSRTVARAAVLVYAPAIALPGLAGSLTGLMAGLVVLGASVGALDVAMNAHAVDLERSSGRTRLSSFHGLFSAGALAGALLGTLAATGGVSPRTQFTVSAAVGVVAAGLAAAALHPAAARPAAPAAPQPGARAAAGGRGGRGAARLLPLSALGLCVLLIEGVMTDWGSVYLAGSLHAGPGLAGAGYAVFALAMMAGRLGGDRTAGRFGPVRVVRFGALLSAAGAVVALASGHPVVSAVAFGAVGLGIAASFPLVVSGASRVPAASPGTAVATVSTTGYFAFLAGPPLIGFLATHSSLRTALLLVPALALAAAALAPFLPAGGGTAPTGAQQELPVLREEAPS